MLGLFLHTIPLLVTSSRLPLEEPQFSSPCLTDVIVLTGLLCFRLVWVFHCRFRVGVNEMDPTLTGCDLEDTTRHLRHPERPSSLGLTRLPLQSFEKDPISCHHSGPTREASYPVVRCPHQSWSGVCFFSHLWRAGVWHLASLTWLCVWSGRHPWYLDYTLPGVMPRSPAVVAIPIPPLPCCFLLTRRRLVRAFACAGCGLGQGCFLQWGDYTSP